jgi:internalin A
MHESFGQIETVFYRFERPEKSFRLSAPWDPEMREPLRETGVQAISLSYMHGWRAKDLDFLLEIPFIRAVRLYGYIGSKFDPIDLSALSRCVWLKTLTLNINNSIETLPPLSCLMNLEVLELFLYRQQLCDKLANPSLRQLHISSALKTTELDLTGLRRLNYLHFRENKLLKDVAISEDIDLRDFEAFANPRLCAVKGLSQIKSDCAIWVGRTQAFQLANLPADTKSLQLASIGKIADLSFLSKLKNLQEICIFGTTDIVDGDLSVLLTLPKLRTVNLDNRRHYSHKRDEIRAILQKRR